MPLSTLLAALGPEIVDPEEESFLLFSQSIPSQNLGFVDSKATSLDLTIGDRDLTILQSPTILSSNRGGGTTGAVVWKITPLFASWITAPSNVLFKQGILDGSSSVLELGCGISGIIGLTLAPRVAEYVLTDQDYVMKLLNQNLAENFQSTSSASSSKGRKSSAKPKRGSTFTESTQKSSNVIAKALDWETDEVTASLSGAGSFEVIIACDCIYNDALIQPLVQTCVDACKLRVGGEQTVCVVAQQLRSAEVFEGWLKAFHAAFRVWRVPDEELVDGLKEDSGFVLLVNLQTLSSNIAKLVIFSSLLRQPDIEDSWASSDGQHDSIHATKIIMDRFVKAKDEIRHRNVHPDRVENILQRTITPPLDPARAIAAQQAKVKTNGKRASAPAIQQNNTNLPQHASLPSSPPIPRNSHFGNPQYQHHQHQMASAPQPPVGRDIWNDTVSSDFDVTKTSIQGSEVPFSQQPEPDPRIQNHALNQDEYGYEEEQEQDDTLHVDVGISTPQGHYPQRYPSEEPDSQRLSSPTLNRKPDMHRMKQTEQVMVQNQFHNGRSGRFDHAHQNLQIRPGNEENAVKPENKKSKKRNRSDPLRDNINHAAPRQHPIQEDEVYGEDDTVYDDLPGRQALTNGDEARDVKEDPNQYETLSRSEAPSQLESPSSQLQAGNINQSQPTEVSPDYNDDQLKAMTYAELKAESWETTPGIAPYLMPEEISVSSKLPIEQKIEFLVSSNQNAANRIGFFEELPTSEWHQAGDLILAKMADTMKKLRDARDNKRKLVETFEAVFEAREQVVRRKSENYEKKLKDMEVSGDRVLSGKF
ncbi:Diaminohydroxyphosphoribosylamino-pyrimidine deaminase [Lachnellula suecica]|uniref:Diaminohydroxyphosphoribosylamino-pyrimidine deaminase n=1 Tax=Lachnellula suecica TaxID=602035 RepID=A0A8T9BVI0_9HELO|nr:Diaminohydroxyphosphoribosylamino-pyrimidine deaminase [Lachnellula suecica]